MPSFSLGAMMLSVTSRLLLIVSVVSNVVEYHDGKEVMLLLDVVVTGLGGLVQDDRLSHEDERKLK